MTIASAVTIEAKLEQIPFSFREMAREELKKEISKLNPSLLLDPDKIYVNIARDTTISSETLTEALLKRSLNEQSFLSDNLARLCLNPTDVNIENQITGLDSIDLKNRIDRLSDTLINTYRQQLDAFWESKELPIPQELEVDFINNFLRSLVEHSSLIERVYQLDMVYPNLKQTVRSYFSEKLSHLYSQDVDSDAVRILLFNKGDELIEQPFLSFDLTTFALNYPWFSHYNPSNTSLYFKIEGAQWILKLEAILQVEDIRTIKSNHQTKINIFWQKNYNNYRILAKFSYMRTLLEQQNSVTRLSEKGFQLALQAMGFSKEKISLKEISLDILEVLSNPNGVEVSFFSFHDQTSSDILKICDLESTNLLIYLPGHKPSFIEAEDERFLDHWISHQIQSPDKLDVIASHFSHASRLRKDLKLDAFLYPDYIDKDKPIEKEVAQSDIFSLIAERQKIRISTDLDVIHTPSPIYRNFYPNYQSTDSAFFATIAAGIEYIPYLLPNMHAVASDLRDFFPNPYVTAAEFMKKALKDKLGLDIDPDKTFIRFSLHEVRIAIYDPIVPPVFDGQKASTTTQSLTEAALNNYREEYSSYGYTTIIYHDSSGKGMYLSKDQILNILPKDIEEIIKEADLDALHKNELDVFWSAHADQMKYFIKHRYLQQALEEFQKNVLEKESLQIISDVAFHSLSMEEESKPINPHIRIEAIIIANYSSTDMFIFRDTSQQRVILYIAGNTNAFFAFTSYEKCICFLEENARSTFKWQKLLTSHFSIEVQEPVLEALKQGPYVEGGTSLLNAPYSRPTDCSFDHTFIQHPITTKPIEKSLFEVIQKNIQERSYLDASTIITSDEELMLKRIISIAEFMEIMLLVPSFGFPILNWAILLALVTEVAANLYMAKNSDTVKERHQAAIDAGINSVEALLIIAFLNFRSLKFSKNQNLPEIIIQDQEETRAIASGSGIFSFSLKTPVSEEIFFDTTESMKVWQMADSDGLLHYLDAKAWFLDKKFLLFTGKTNKSNHLIISSHGGYFPKSDIIGVPKNTELVVLGPHGWQIFDPGTAKIAKGLVIPYGIINESTAIPTQTALYPSLFSHSPNIHIHPRQTDVKLLAGTNVPGHIRNYTLHKYQKFGAGQESYLDIVQIVHHSRHPFPSIYKIGFKPVDVLTVRNRGGMLPPTLKDVFESLQSRGIHYDRITLEFCRANQKKSLIRGYKPASF